MEANLTVSKKTGHSINYAFASHFAKSVFLTVAALFKIIKTNHIEIHTLFLETNNLLKPNKPSLIW